MTLSSLRMTATASATSWWACWKKYVGRPEADQLRGLAMNLLGNGLFEASRHEDALSVQEAELSIMRRLGAPEDDLLITQGNLTSTYQMLGRNKQALSLRRDVYSRYLKLSGEEGEKSLGAAVNYASCLHDLQRYQEAKSLMLKMMPVARRVLGENDDHAQDEANLRADAPQQ